MFVETSPRRERDLAMGMEVMLRDVLCGFMDVYMTESHYSLGMVTRTWSTLYLQRRFLIYTVLLRAYRGNV